MVGKCTTNNEKKNLKLPFDLCRWKVENEDAGVAHGAHRLFFYQQAFAEAVDVAALSLHMLVQLGVKEDRVTSRGLWHIILQHVWEEGTRWSGQP